MFRIDILSFTVLLNKESKPVFKRVLARRMRLMVAVLYRSIAHKLNEI